MFLRTFQPSDRAPLDFNSPPVTESVADALVSETDFNAHPPADASVVAGLPAVATASVRGGAGRDLHRRRSALIRNPRQSTM